MCKLVSEALNQKINGAGLNFREQTQVFVLSSEEEVAIKAKDKLFGLSSSIETFFPLSTPWNNCTTSEKPTKVHID